MSGGGEMDGWRDGGRKGGRGGGVYSFRIIHPISIIRTCL